MSESTRSRIAASSQSAAVCSTCSRRPRTGRCGSSCSVTRSSRCGGFRPSPSARLETPRWSRWRLPPSCRSSIGSWPRSPRSRRPDERPDIAELLPVQEFHPFLELVPAQASILIAGEEDVTPALSDHWQDVSAAFHDQDAAPRLRRPAGDRRGDRGSRPDPPIEHRPGSAFQLPRAGSGHPGAQHQGGRAGTREADALGLPDRRRVCPARRGRAVRLQPGSAEGAVVGWPQPNRTRAGP